MVAAARFLCLGFCPPIRTREGPAAEKARRGYQFLRVDSLEAGETRREGTNLKVPKRILFSGLGACKLQKTKRRRKNEPNIEPNFGRPYEANALIKNMISESSEARNEPKTGSFGPSVRVMLLTILKGRVENEANTTRRTKRLAGLPPSGRALAGPHRCRRPAIESPGQ